MKKILYLMLLVFPFIASADEVHDFDMDIYINSNGDAYVTEVWDATSDMGSEFYHSYYNYDGSDFSDFSVSIDNKQYTFIDDWDVDGSLEDKQYKNGFNYVENGIEICFGKTSFGRHKYISKYKITNFVRSLNDSDMIYWTLLPYNNGGQFKSVNVNIYSDFEYDDDTQFYLYGKGGMEVRNSDGHIEISSNGSLKDSEYVTILVKFDKNTFDLSSKLDEDFSYYLDMANENAIKYEKESRVEKIIGIVMFVFFGITMFFVIMLCSSAFNAVGYYKLDFGKNKRKMAKNLPNFRDIPCNKDIYKAYFISVAYYLTKKKTDIFGAILLKWVKEDKISITKINNKDLAMNLGESTFDREIEQKLYDMLKEASKDNILESKEFEKWCKKNSNKIIKWFDDLLNEEGNVLVNEGYLKQKGKKGLFYTNVYVDDMFISEGKKLYGLKKYLIEFSKIGEKEPIEVKLWDEYLMYAQIFGIAKEVAKQFKKLYPEIIENSNYGFDYDTFMFVNTISNTSMTYASSYSSSGGGGGSFGGGGAGGAGGR